MESSRQSASGIEGLIEEGEALRRLSADPDRAAPVPSARRTHTFYTGISAAFVVVAFAAFAPTYYLRPLSDAPPLSPLLHVHGAVFTAWLLLLFAQSALVASHRVALHRRLGIAGALLAGIMVPLGIITAIGAAQRGAARGGLDPVVFLIFPLGQVVLFAVFLGIALVQRRRPETHRRFVIVATTCLMAPAIARLPLIGERPILSLGLSALFVVAGMVHDWKTLGRPHRVYVIGALVLLVSGPVRFGLGHTAAWQSLARALVGN
ncbi:MAG: hypothetical protein HOW73_09490 [Polyangiaceae bacterium]|nr:hypothetical protein [Polyangiaceae bacterium]